ncbi:YqaE/Pmp3 family membrane protein [filamentous cyanobacterium CCP2]|nr:YqaE/Pmp3 family membrane protein [filamentous cyanobacterium CCP2]
MLLKVLLGILLPPVGVFLTYGVSTTLIINVVLTILGWVPGSIHAVWAILKQAELGKQQAENPTQPN